MPRKGLAWLSELETLAASRAEHPSLADLRKGGWVTMDDLYKLLNRGVRRCGLKKIRATIRGLIAEGHWESVETVAYGDDGKINRRVIYRKCDGSNPAD